MCIFFRRNRPDANKRQDFIQHTRLQTGLYAGASIGVIAKKDERFFYARDPLWRKKLLPGIGSPAVDAPRRASRS